MFASDVIPAPDTASSAARAPESGRFVAESLHLLPLMLAGTDVLKVNPRSPDLVFPHARPFPAVADDRPGDVLGRQINGQDAVRPHGPQLSPDHLLFAGNLLDL